MPYVNPPTGDQVSGLEVMDSQEPDGGSITLSRAMLDRLYDYRRKTGAASWDHTIERLLAEAQAHAAVRENMIELLV